MYIIVFENDPWFMPDATEEQKEQIRQAPTKLCHFAWAGSPETLEFVFDKYSDYRYEPSSMIDGSFVGSPESCFYTAAQLYLQ